MSKDGTTQAEPSEDTANDTIDLCLDLERISEARHAYGAEIRQPLLEQPSVPNDATVGVFRHRTQEFRTAVASAA